jgi:hypothetical protein
MRCVDLQSTSSLLKAGAAIDLPKLQEGIHIFLQEAKRVRNNTDRETFLAALRDLHKFLENMLSQATLEDRLSLDQLTIELTTTINGLKNPIGYKLSQLPTKEKTWKVAKKALFNVAHYSNQALSTALTGALSGATLSLITGQDLHGVAIGAISGFVAQGGAAVLDLGINPLVNQIPCSPTKKASIRYYLRTLAMPIIRILLALKLTAWANRKFSHKKTDNSSTTSQPILANTSSSAPLLHTSSQPPSSDMVAASTMASSGADVHKLITLSFPPDTNVNALLAEKVPSATILSIFDSWKATTVTIDILEKEAPSLLGMHVTLQSVESEQEQAATLIGSIWNTLFNSMQPLPSSPFQSDTLQGVLKNTTPIN